MDRKYWPVAAVLATLTLGNAWLARAIEKVAGARPPK